MSIDALQAKIRKRKNPTALVLSPVAPPRGFDTGKEYVQGVLKALKDVIPAVRVQLGTYVLLGEAGMGECREVLEAARSLGYYVILDWLVQESPQQAVVSARALLEKQVYPCDAVTLNLYPGSDSVKPYLAWLEEKAVFVSLRTANRSGSELQELRTGGRVVYTAAGALAHVLGEGTKGKYGYAPVAGILGANSAESIRTIRQMFPGMFLLLEGLDGVGGNGKNVSLGFDRMGHGAVCCVGDSIFNAWQDAPEDADPLEAALAAANRVKAQIARYVKVL